MLIQPYLNFDGRCEEALEFYSKAIGAEVTFRMRMKESPDPHPPGMTAAPADFDQKILHAAFRVGDSMVLASDGYANGKPEFKGVTMSLSLATDEEGKRIFDALSDGGQVQMPLAETFFATSFGMLADRFGVPWMLMVAKPMK